VLEPVQGAGDQEALHLAAAEIVDVGVPVAVEALARIEMLVERGAVEAGETVAVGREVRRHPVEDDAQAGGMRAVDEAGEALGRAEAAGRRKQAERLVAPRAAERMLGDRQQLEMAEAHVDGVGDQPVGHVVPGLAGAQPGAEMHFVDRDGGVLGVALRAARHPVGVVPVERLGRGDDRGRRRRRLGLLGERIGLLRLRHAARADDIELVARA
jgi:hypothetical protein